MDKDMFNGGILFFGIAYFTYIFFGISSDFTLFIILILILLGMSGLLQGLFPHWEMWKDKEKKIIKQPESNECPDCARKKREGVHFCNTCGRSL
jgi:hypothetical protein